MSILTLEHCSHSFGGRSIFEDVSFRLLKGEHVGLLGANGEGKSTFMKIITRKLEPEEGKITWSKNVKVGYLDQHAVLEPGMTIHDALAQAFAGLFDIEKQITAGYETMADCTEEEMNELLEQIGEWQDTLEHHDFYQIDVKIEEVAQALGCQRIVRRPAHKNSVSEAAFGKTGHSASGRTDQLSRRAAYPLAENLSAEL